LRPNSVPSAGNSTCLVIPLPGRERRRKPAPKPPRIVEMVSLAERWQADVPFGPH
jgi:hypothetical protein